MLLLISKRFLFRYRTHLNMYAGTFMRLYGGMKSKVIICTSYLPLVVLSCRESEWASRYLTHPRRWKIDRDRWTSVAVKKHHKERIQQQCRATAIQLHLPSELNRSHAKKLAQHKMWGSFSKRECNKSAVRCQQKVAPWSQVAAIEFNGYFYGGARDGVGGRYETFPLLDACCRHISLL